MSRRLWVLLVVFGVVALLAGCSSPTLTGAKVKAQDYGPNAQYQVEISLNCTSKQNCTLQNVIGQGKGFGLWLWFALNNDGTGDYAGADCGHNLPGDAPRAGAFGDQGDLTWETQGDNLVIHGVKLFGGTVPAGDIVVPAKLGHYVEDGSQVFVSPPLPVTGTTQIQIAP